MALAGRLANVKITSTANAWSTGLAATLSTDGVTLQLNDETKRHWDRITSTAPKVYDDSTAATSTQFTVNTVQGIVSFTTPHTTSHTYTIDALYKTATAVAGGREWQLSLDADLLEVSSFQSSGWRNYIKMMTGGTVTINSYWDDGTITDLLQISDEVGDIIVELLPGSTGTHRYEGWTKISSDSIATPTDGVVGESIELTIDGRLYWSTST